MKNEDLTKLYLNYLENGMTVQDLLTMMEYDYDLFVKKKYGFIDINTETNIVSYDDAILKFEALKEAYKELIFPGYKLILRITINKNTTLD